MFDDDHDYDEDVAFQIALLESQETARTEAARRTSNEKAGIPFNFSRGSPIFGESDVLSHDSDHSFEDFATGSRGWHGHTAKSKFSYLTNTIIKDNNRSLTPVCQLPNPVHLSLYVFTSNCPEHYLPPIMTKALEFENTLP